jgi:hypothetical protein
VSWIRRTVGLDGVDLVIQVGVTFFLMVMAGSSGAGPDEGVLIAGVGAISMVVLGVRRHLALKRGPQAAIGEITGEVLHDRIADLDARLAELDAVNYRVHELEERLDFAERLLAQAREEPNRLEAPR